MGIIPGLEWTFDTVAAEYDKWSPPYVRPLYDDLFAYQPIGPESLALEIGIGTGQATLPILETGCQLTAVELGRNLAAFSRQKFREYPNFSVVNAPFQDYAGQEASFDLIYSAGAFHWIPEELGYAKVFRLLKSGGVFARFAKHPYYNKNGQEAMCVDMQKVYARYMAYSSPSPEYTEEQAAARAALAEKYGFRETTYHLYARQRVYSAQDYLALIATQSDHIILKESDRPAFYGGIRAAIDAHGGAITLYDTIDLALARKP